MNDMNRDEAQKMADRAADRAVSELFRALGVDVNNQRDLNDLRADLIYSRRLRRMTESTTAKAWLTLVGLTAVGAALFIWTAIKHAVGVDS